MVPFIPRRGSPSSSPALFCRAGAAAWNAPQQLHPVVPGAQDAGWAAPGTWVPSGWAVFRTRGCSSISRLLPGLVAAQPLPQGTGCLVPLPCLQGGAAGSFPGWRVLLPALFLAGGFFQTPSPRHKVPPCLWGRVLSPFPGHRVAPCPFPGCPIQGKPQGLSPALPSPPASRLSACERSFIGLFDVVEPRTGETFIKALPRGPGDYEY